MEFGFEYDYYEQFSTDGTFTGGTETMDTHNGLVIFQFFWACGGLSKSKTIWLIEKRKESITEVYSNNTSSGSRKTGSGGNWGRNVGCLSASVERRHRRVIDGV